MDTHGEVWGPGFGHMLVPPTCLNFFSPLDGSYLSKTSRMAPMKTETSTPNDESDRPEPHPSFIQVAKPYIFEQTIQECMTATGVSQLKEDSIRLQGVTWIDNVRKALHLYVDPLLLKSFSRIADFHRPVRTFNTAVVYYHKFRLVHADTDYSYVVSRVSALISHR